MASSWVIRTGDVDDEINQQHGLGYWEMKHPSTVIKW